MINPNCVSLPPQATDPDEGNASAIQYGMGIPEEATPSNPPFLVQPDNGNLYTYSEFLKNDSNKFRFDVYAQNHLVEDKKRTDTEVIVSFVQIPQIHMVKLKVKSLHVEHLFRLNISL